MAFRLGRQRLSATPIIDKGLVYPLQNLCASKSATHSFASKSDTHHKNPKASAFGFFICAAGTTSFAWHTQHHLTVRSTSLPLAAQMNDVALRANDVLCNDVGLRPMKLRFAQTELDSKLSFRL